MAPDVDVVTTGAGPHGLLTLRSAPAARAVPPGRIGYDLRAPALLLHTFSTHEAFDGLRADGVLRADPARAEPDFAAAYAWLCEQYRRRIPGGSGAPHLWFWARTTRQHLVETARLNRGSVLLTCRVPAERILLSLFDEWHAVLNRFELGPYDETEAEIDARIEEWEALDRAHGLDGVPVTEWPAHLRERMTRSWEHAFDVACSPRRCVVQGVTEALYAHAVVDAVLIE
jgi:Domain of unknown function (DUF3841)